ncbi:MAG: sulfite reductase [Parachlamydiales bacterium]|nr:sulfite reductase [Parachlamydiales bacterium]
MYTLKNPFIAKIKQRERISKERSTKKAYYLVLDIKDSDINFKPGDSIAIIPQNDPRIVDLTITHMNAKPDMQIENPRTKEKVTLFDFLLKSANLSKTSAALIKLLDKKINPEEIKQLISNHHLWDILKKYPKHKLPPQEIVNTLLPILPRLYSAASSLEMFPNEIHLIITHLSYELSKIKRNGVTTEFLCHIAKVLKTPIPIYVQPSTNFTLTKDSSSPIIMIAAGCGIAPFKAFLEKRYISESQGPNWLFFGERHSKTDFYFEKFFKDLEEKNILRLTTAFSRDQEEKIYVQDRLLENAEDVWQWIHQGAYIYVCGDIKMGASVDQKLIQIFQEQGNLHNGQAREFLKNLFKNKRYLKDVY